MVILLPPLSGRLVARARARVALVIGGVGMAAGALLLTGLRATTPLALLLAAYGVFGVGLGIVNVPITTAAVAGHAAGAVRRRGVDRLHLTPGRTDAGRRGDRGDREHRDRRRGVARVRGGDPSGWWIIVGCGATIVILGLLTTTAFAKASAERATAGFDDEPGDVRARRRRDPAAPAPSRTPAERPKPTGRPPP